MHGLFSGRISRKTYTKATLFVVTLFLALHLWMMRDDRPVDPQEPLRQETCDPSTAYQLSQSYRKSGHDLDVIELEKNFHAHCAIKIVQLKWAAFHAAKRLQNLRLAETIVSELIRDHPKDADYLGWRGQLYEIQGRWQEAVADYEKVLVLKPKIRDVPLNLRDAYRQLHRPCEALGVQNLYANTYPDIQNDSGIQELKRRLEGECTRG